MASLKKHIFYVLDVGGLWIFTSYENFQDMKKKINNNIWIRLLWYIPPVSIVHYTNDNSEDIIVNWLIYMYQ